MAADFGKLTGQSTYGQAITLGSGTTLHTVPEAEKHEITILANGGTAQNITVKVDGESTGVVESIEANKSRIVYTGVVVGKVGGTVITGTKSGAAAVAWGKYIKLA